MSSVARKNAPRGDSAGHRRGQESSVLMRVFAKRLMGPGFYGTLAGVGAALALFSSFRYIRDAALGNSEAMMAGLVLWAFERHLDGRRDHALYRHAPDAFGLFKLSAEIPGAWLARHIFEYYFAWVSRPRPPMRAIRRTENHYAGRGDRSSDVCDAAVVPDEQARARGERGNFG